MKYRPDLASVLNEVSVEIAPGQHVGIVGRTGSGLIFKFDKLQNFRTKLIFDR